MFIMSKWPLAVAFVVFLYCFSSSYGQIGDQKKERDNPFKDIIQEIQLIRNSICNSTETPKERIAAFVSCHETIPQGLESYFVS